MIVCKEVIIADLETRGTGTGTHSPLRRLTQVYEKSGKLIAEYDPSGGYTLEDLLDFADYTAKAKGTFTQWAAQRRCV